MRRDHRIVSAAVIVAVGVNTDGRREVLGITPGDSEAEPLWTEFLRPLRHRGLRGVKLIVSDAHDGLPTASAKDDYNTRARIDIASILISEPVAPPPKRGANAL